MNKLLIVLVAAFALTACNTLAGVGKDIESLGKVFQDKGEGKVAPKAAAKPAPKAEAKK